MGGDSLRDLPHWYAYDQFVNLCDSIGVMRRPGSKIDLDSLETQIPGIKAKVKFVDTPLLDIAASQIRQRIQSGQPYQYYLPPSVFKFVQTNKLYETHLE